MIVKLWLNISFTFSGSLPLRWTTHLFIPSSLQPSFHCSTLFFSFHTFTTVLTMSDSDGPPPEPAGLDGLPPMYSIAKGEVVSVQTYGAFVRLPGYRKEGNWVCEFVRVELEFVEYNSSLRHLHPPPSMQTGLVHVSEMSASRVENASEIVDMGEQVWIKVIGREVPTHS